MAPQFGSDCSNGNFHPAGVYLNSLVFLMHDALYFLSSFFCPEALILVFTVCRLISVFVFFLTFKIVKN